VDTKGGADAEDQFQISPFKSRFGKALAYRDKSDDFAWVRRRMSGPAVI